MSQPSGNGPPAPTGGGSGSSSGQAEETRGNHSKKKKKKSYGSNEQGGFTGKCEDLKMHVYDVTPGKSGFDTFARTTTEIGEYIARTCKDAGEFRTAMDPENLGFAALNPPTEPTDPIVKGFGAATKRVI